ncbi:MAG TPA: exopolysaccharide biosynthesis polyprenyl glycosylphosphotransferase [Syntrophorhabdaceae bacterium]|nr:exopolysaccharide biosynthesis polyprenyl glycosylphosphotransferase [Syntrophorhabdaceae bacterium]
MKMKKIYPDFLLLALDIFVIYFSIILAFYTRPFIGLFMNLVPLSHGLSTYIYKFWMVLIIVVLIAYYRGYGLVINFWDELLTFIKSLSISFLIVWMVISLQKGGEEVSRIIITLSFIYMLFLMPLFRAVLKYVMYKINNLRKPAYIVNNKDKKRSEVTISAINKEWYSGLRIIDSIDSLNANNIKEKQVEVCFVPISSLDEETVKTIKPYVKNFILVSEIPGLSFMNTEVKTFLNNNIALITVSKGLLSIQKTLIKRGFDILFSIIGLIVFSPLFVIISVLIKLDSDGPVFFKHKRCGKNLREFEMYKFRTMKAEGESELNDFLAKNPDAAKEIEERNKLENDPRITKTGRILRKTSLDELPQFINVLKGDMSIVGPRPDEKSAIERYYNEYREIYNHIRPGMTGLWQVSGRSEIKYEERVRLDYFYLLNWSMWLDIVIIIKTFRAILSARGAY